MARIGHDQLRNFFTFRPTSSTTRSGHDPAFWESSSSRPISSGEVIRFDLWNASASRGVINHKAKRVAVPPVRSAVVNGKFNNTCTLMLDEIAIRSGRNRAEAMFPIERISAQIKADSGFHSAAAWPLPGSLSISA